MQHKTLVKGAARLGSHLRLDPYLALLDRKRERNNFGLNERIEIDGFEIRLTDIKHGHYSED